MVEEGPTEDREEEAQIEGETVIVLELSTKGPNSRKLKGERGEEFYVDGIEPYVPGSLWKDRK